jgi:hypothetical protein
MSDVDDVGLNVYIPMLHQYFERLLHLHIHVEQSCGIFIWSFKLTFLLLLSKSLRVLPVLSLRHLSLRLLLHLTPLSRPCPRIQLPLRFSLVHTLQSRSELFFRSCFLSTSLSKLNLVKLDEEEVSMPSNLLS